MKVILPPWSDGESIVTKILVRRLHKKGFSCVAYFFPRSIISPDFNATVEDFNFIRNEIRADISKIKAEHNFQKIDIIAPSLGVVSACLIANNNKDISDLFFVVPGSCLASSLWHSIRMNFLVKIYKKENLDEEKLRNIWQGLAPKNNINNLANEHVFITVSKADKIIPYHFGQELIDLMKKSYPNNVTTEENNHLGHYLTIIKYFVFSKELLK